MVTSISFLENVRGNGKPLTKCHQDEDLLQLQSLTTSDSVNFLRKVEQLHKLDRKGPLVVELLMPEFHEEGCKNAFVIFKKLKKLQNAGTEVRIHWYYKEYAMDLRGIGECFCEIFDLNIVLLVHNN